MSGFLSKPLPFTEFCKLTDEGLRAAEEDRRKIDEMLVKARGRKPSPAYYLSKSKGE